MKKLISILNNKRGETLLEVIISAAIFAILTIGVVTMFILATDISLSAFRINKEDAQITGKLDGESTTANVVIDKKETADGAPKFELSFGAGDPANIQAEGKYETAKTGHNKLPMVQFKP